MSDNEKLDKLIVPGMDASCAPICNAMNLIPSIHTMSSCEGHGKDCFFVMFYCRQMSSLHFLCDVFKESIVAKKMMAAYLRQSEMSLNCTIGIVFVLDALRM